MRGEAPPSTLKVAMNEMGGYRNSFTVALTGLNVEQKAAFAQAAFWDSCPYGPDDFDSCVSRVVYSNKADPQTQEEATAIWRLTVKDADERKVGRAFSNANVHTGLSSIPGMYGLGGGPGGGTPYGIYRPAVIASKLVPQYVHVLGGANSLVDSVAPTGEPVEVEVAAPAGWSDGPTLPVALGTIVGARSGDKGGDANLGVYARSDAGFDWLDWFLTTERLQELLPEAAPLVVDRYRLPNIRSLNFVIRGLLEEGVAASTRQDSQAKALGEWLRARIVDVPESLL